MVIKRQDKRLIVKDNTFSPHCQEYWNSLTKVVQSDHLGTDQLELCKLWKSMSEEVRQRVRSELETVIREDITGNYDEVAILLMKFGIYRTVNSLNRQIKDMNHCVQRLDAMETSHIQQNLLAMFLKARGNFFEAVEQHERALVDFTRAISIRPNYSIAYTNRANLYSRLSMETEALNDFQKSLELIPNSGAYVGRATLFCEMQNYEQAIMDYDRALEIDIDNYVAWFNRSITHYDLGNFVFALRDIVVAGQGTPSDFKGTVYNDHKAIVVKGSEDPVFKKR